MSCNNLFALGLFCRSINVPDLEIPGLCTNKDVIIVNLIKIGRTSLSFEGLLDRLRPCLNVNVYNDNLLSLEASDCEHSG